MYPKWGSIYVHIYRYYQHGGSGEAAMQTATPSDDTTAPKARMCHAASPLPPPTADECLV